MSDSLHAYFEYFLKNVTFKTDTNKKTGYQWAACSIIREAAEGLTYFSTPAG
jgi:hypothetical protein